MFYEMTGFTSSERGTVHGAPEAPDLATSAIFLDFDGVLVDIAETPDAIVVPDDLGDLLNRLSERTGGATAIISGRAAGTIEKFVPGYEGDIVGSHGAERRIGGGPTETHALAGSEQVEKIRGVVRSFAALDTGFLVEDKPCGVVLHFRRNPDLYSEANRFMESLLGHFPEFKIQQAKMAVEMKPADTGKVGSIRWLFEREPYAGRMPIYFGDDVTDEPAMEHCVEAGGLAIKVGEGETRANHRLDTVDEVRNLLAAWAGTGT
jgi:trehalose 6-phosphate phosphatase